MLFVRRRITRLIMFGVALRLRLGGLRTWLIYNANQAFFGGAPGALSLFRVWNGPVRVIYVLAEAHIQCAIDQWRPATVEKEYSQDRRNNKYKCIAFSNVYMISVLGAAVPFSIYEFHRSSACHYGLFL